MPQIRQYDPQIEQVGGMNEPHATAENIGGVAETLNTASQGIMGAATTLHEYNNRVDMFQAEKIAADQQGQMIQSLEEQKKQAPTGAKGFAQSFTQSAQKNVDDIMQSDAVKDMSTQAQAMLQTRMIHNNNRRYLEAYHFEASSTASAAIDDINKTVQATQNLVFADPSKRDEGVSTIQNLISAAPSSWGDNQLKSKITKDAVQNVYDASMNGVVDNLQKNPHVTASQVDQALNQFKDEKGDWQSNVSSGAYERNIKELQNYKNVLVEKQEKLVADDFSVKMNQNENEGTYPGKDQGLYSPAWINANISDPAQKQKLLQQYQSSENIGEASKVVSSQPFSQTQEQLSTMNGALGKSENYGADLDKFNALSTAYQNAQKAWKKDQVGYVLNESQAASTQYNAFVANPTPENRDNYVSTVQAETKKINPYSAIKLMPQVEAAQFKAKMQSLGTDPSSADEAFKMINEQQQKWGKYWPTVARDLAATQSINNSQFAAATLADDPKQMPFAEDLLRAGNVKDAEARKILGGGGVSQSDKLTTAALTQFGQTNPDRASNQTYNALHDAISNYAVDQSMKNGGIQNMQQFVNDAYKRLVGDKYSFRDTYRVPTSQNADQIAQGVDAVKSNLSKMNLVLPQSQQGYTPEQTQEQYIQHLQGSGKFLTNGDDSGLLLKDGTGYQVYQKQNGKNVPVMLKWDDLKTMSSKNFSNSNSPMVGS